MQGLPIYINHPMGLQDPKKLFASQTIPSGDSSVLLSPADLFQKRGQPHYSPALRPMPWASLPIIQNARYLVGSQFRLPELADGRLACAWAVSTALKQAGVINKKVAGCDLLKGVLTQNGFNSFLVHPSVFDPALYQPGDVVFFAKNSYGNGHVGIISKIERRSDNSLTVYMIHNDAGKREVVETNLNRYSRHPISIYRLA